MCQCPITGLLHFYNKEELVQELEKRGCQCPITGLLHFYSDVKQQLKPGKRCQCPITGLLHFYEKQKSIIMKLAGCVNALSRAYSISTSLAIYFAMSKVCVNALSRAYSISTVGSGKPVFMRLPEPVFTCNSQNILTINFSRPFFVLFTLCSYLQVSLYQIHPHFAILNQNKMRVNCRLNCGLAARKLLISAKPPNPPKPLMLTNPTIPAKPPKLARPHGHCKKKRHQSKNRNTAPQINSQYTAFRPHPTHPRPSHTYRRNRLKANVTSFTCPFCVTHLSLQAASTVIPLSRSREITR